VLNERMPDNCERWKLCSLFDHSLVTFHSKLRRSALKIRIEFQTYLRIPSA
jgi:hypothetical protein